MRCPSCTSQLSQNASLHCVDIQNIWTRRRKEQICHLLPLSLCYTGPTRVVGRLTRQPPPRTDHSDQTSSLLFSLTRSDTCQGLWVFLWCLWRAGRTPIPRSNDESGTSSHLRVKRKSIQGRVGVLEPSPGDTFLGVLDCFNLSTEPRTFSLWDDFAL